MINFQENLDPSPWLSLRFRSLPAVNLPLCLPPRWNAQLSSPPVRPLMSSALPAALTQTGRLPTENTSSRAPTLVDDTPASGFCIRNYFPVPSQCKTIFHFPLGEFDISED